LSAEPTNRITIALPVYNGDRFLAEALESVLKQTYPHWELVVYDNASTDGTEEIARDFAQRDPRIRYVRRKRNIGLARNFSAAFRPAQTEYFKWMAHDDILAPDMLERCLEALERHPECVVAYPAAVAIDENGTPDPDFDLGAEPDLSSPNAAERFRAYCGLPRPSVARYIFGLMRAEAVRSTRLMRSHMWADVTLLSELVLQGPFLAVPETTNYLRVFPGHATALMAKQDLRAWQRVLDPRLATPIGTTISRYRRYEEYFASVARSDLPLGTKVKLFGFCATLPVRRVPEVVSRQLAGVRR